MKSNLSTLGPVWRLKRIKYMSRFMKGLILAYFIAIPLLIAYGRTMSGLGQPAAPPVFGMTAKERLYQGIFYSLNILAVVALYRLLSIYEKGVIFSPAISFQIRRLGNLAMAYALLKACGPILLPHEGLVFVPTMLLNFLLSPWLFAGCLIITITWIMDEARKIQEEQEMTV
jgi:hypothetical protein